MPAAMATKARGARARATKLVNVNGRFVSAKSKTGNPACSQAMSTWVRSRHGGPAASPDVFKLLGQCRKMARQNKQAAAKQASGKLAEGRGTWQRSEKAAALRAGRTPEGRQKAATAAAIAYGRAKWEARGKAAASASPAPSKLSLEDFASKVKEHAARSPSGWFGDGKVFISHAHAATKHAHGLDLPAFKKRLLEAHNARHLELGRADLVEAMDPKDVKSSSTPHMGADYHFIRVNKASTSTPAKPAAEKFGLAQQSAHGKKATTFENTGGRTRPLLDIKAGDKPGQTSMFDKDKPRSERADHRTKEDQFIDASLERNRSQRAKQAKRLRAAREATRDPSAHTDHAPGTVTNLRTNLIHFDPDRFQYKLAAQGTHGVTDALHGVKKFDPELSGVLQVWKDPGNGKTYVVNGHHRLDLANKLGADKVAVRFIHAKSAEDARSIGALTNIAEGRGNSLDAAKFFRDTGHNQAELEGRGIPMKERVATEGLALANLHEPIFKRVVNGDLSHSRGALIGGLPQEHQSDLVKLIEKAPRSRPVTDSHIRNLVDSAHAATVVKTKTKSLFGDEEDDRSTLLHRAAAASHIQDRLGKEKRVFGTVAKERNAAELERGGNKIDAAESGKISSAAAQNLATFNLLKDRAGPVSRLLNEAAERVHKGEHPRKVHDETYKRLPQAIRESLEGAA